MEIQTQRATFTTEKKPTKSSNHDEKSDHPIIQAIMMMIHHLVAPLCSALCPGYGFGGMLRDARSGWPARNVKNVR